MGNGERPSDHRPASSPVVHLAEALIGDLGRREAIALCRNNHWDGVLRAINAAPRADRAGLRPGAAAFGGGNR
ncbi:MAG: hypothetical protein D6744_02580 [Planctomycetota bacterium]|nr:MAG: hypothetical protein D6744_02580 [Planctomycetota bacterium]